MNDLTDTTGVQNPIFKIFQNQQNSQQKVQNPNVLNPNSLNPIQIGNNPSVNNGINSMQGPNNIINPQQPIINAGINQMPGQYNPIGQMGFGINNQIIPQQGGSNNQVGMINQINPNIQQQPINPINPQIIGNNGMINNNNNTMQQLMQQQLIAQQNLQQQMIAAQIANKQAQINNILNNMGQGAGINNPVNSSNPINQSQQQSQPGINVNFRVTGEAGQETASIMIQCMPDEKISAIIERYRAKSGDNSPTKKFTFNAKNLVPSLTLSEAGISNNANIFVRDTKDIVGGL